ncbi:ferredoxin-NADP reductase [Kibdelosporangium banguiense]|uniref:Ferredoxin-NADP reductase n=1 Tax=Kibdelosporangium banguiense TaxID=1365924 RepID=A0ABS4TTL5_9PSEU|nr:ferredoxin reductase [Kibdelosporangium banguiense]MBP2327732.1 ferredoxin-NADP reductase [Kibdelosporangium banguiense]
MVIRRLPWLVGTVTGIRAETATARTIVFDVPGWGGHIPGQHVDIRLTAPDGYSTQRSYSIAAPAEATRVEIMVQLVEGGEVSTFLVEDLLIGDEIELRGPIGGWFTWQPGDVSPVLLVAGGSGVVPLMAMIRAGRPVDFDLVYSVRTRADACYLDELSRHGLNHSVVYTREESGDGRPAGRIGPQDLPSSPAGRTYVCGPTGFVEAVTKLLLDQGSDPDTIRTERFGPSGG